MTSRRAAKGPARRITLPENGEALLSDLQRALEQNDVRSAIAAWQRILEAAHIDLGARAIAMATVIAARVDPATGVRAFDRPEQQDLWQSIQTQLTPPIRWPREPHLPAARGRPRSIDPYKEHLRNMQAAVWLHVHLLSLPKRGVRARSEREGAEHSNMQRKRAQMPRAAPTRERRLIMKVLRDAPGAKEQEVRERLEQRGFKYKERGFKDRLFRIRKYLRKQRK
jgi:hypothetical protein